MARRAAFDPLRMYVANRDFVWKGKKFVAGDPFDDRSDMRRMRQLYDNRHLRMSEVDSGAPNFKQMKDDELRQWLIDAGKPGLAHERASRQRLLERCARIWLEQKASTDGIAAGHVRTEDGGAVIQRETVARGVDEGGPIKRERVR
jgi:hypothetical protein